MSVTFSSTERTQQHDAETAVAAPAMRVASYQATINREQYQVVRRALCSEAVVDNVPLIEPEYDIKMTTGIKSTSTTSTEKGANYVRIPIKAPEHPDSGKWRKNKPSGKWGPSTAPEENKGRRLLLHFGCDVRVMPINLYEKVRQKDLTAEQEIAGMRQHYNTATGVVQLKMENPGTAAELERINAIEKITMQLRQLLFHNKGIVKKISEFEHTSGLQLMRTRDDDELSAHNITAEEEIPVVYMEFLGGGASFMKSNIMEEVSPGRHAPITIEELAKCRQCFTMRVVAQLDSIVLMNNGIWSVKLVVHEALVSRPTTTGSVDRIDGSILYLLPGKPVLRPDGSMVALKDDTQEVVVIEPHRDDPAIEDVDHSDYNSHKHPREEEEEPIEDEASPKRQIL